MRAIKSSFHQTEAISGHEMAKLIKMTLKLFDHWQLDTASQLVLLGLSTTSRAVLYRYLQQQSIKLPHDMLDRVGWLLAIHQALRSLYPKNPEICYRWVSLPNTLFQHSSPLEYMTNNGLIGIAKVARYLQAQLVR